MIVSAFVAASENGVIGRNGQIPWSLPADFARMREITMGHPIIMGRATHESIGRTLPGRLNVVISSKPGYKPLEGSLAARSLNEALELEQVKNANEVFIFGGERVFREAMPRTDKIYLTRVHAVIEGDRFFHYESNDWRVASEEKHSKDPANQYDYDFVVLERRR